MNLLVLYLVFHSLIYSVTQFLSGQLLPIFTSTDKLDNCNVLRAGQVQHHGTVEP